MEEENKLDVSRQSELVEKQDWSKLKSFINEIFAKNGYPKVKKFAKEFSDGRLFLLLFNLLFDQRMDLPFTSNPDPEAKIHNWNKINAMICFNYL